MGDMKMEKLVNESKIARNEWTSHVNCPEFRQVAGCEW